MSLVGTRPILQDELRQYELHHRARIAIKPGIAVFRANVFFFSLYVYSAFRTMVSKVTNCQLMLFQLDPVSDRLFCGDG